MASTNIPDEVYNWLVDVFSGLSHCTRFCGTTSGQLDISACIIQGSTIGPASYVVNAADLTTVTAGNLMFKYADDSYIVIPAINVNSRSTELDHVDQWPQNDNLRLSRAKSAEIIFTNCKRKHTEDQPPQITDIRRVTSIKMLAMTSLWRVTSLSVSMSATLSASARSRCTPWNCYATTAWVTTHWGTSTSPSSSPNCCMHHRHGRVLPARPISNVSKHLSDVLIYPAWLVHRRWYHAISTSCWHERQPLREHTPQLSLSPCFAQISPGQNWSYLQS